MNSTEEFLVDEWSENAVPNVSGEINIASGAVSVFEAKSVAAQYLDLCRSDHAVNMALTPY